MERFLDNEAVKYWVNTQYAGNVRGMIKHLHPDITPDDQHAMGERFRRRLRKSKKLTTADWKEIENTTHEKRQTILEFYISSHPKREKKITTNTNNQNFVGAETSQNNVNLGNKGGNNSLDLLQSLKDQIDLLQNQLEESKREKERLLDIIEQLSKK